MSDNQKTKGPNELKRTNHIINEQIAKIQKDTQELINRTIDGQPSKVSVVKISDSKIIIEVDLNETNQSLKNIENLVDQPENSKNKPLKENQSSNSTSTNLTTTKSKTKLDKDDNSIDQKSNLNNQSNLDLDTSCDENKPLKGILKYTNSWKKRTLSESSFDYSSSSFTSDHEDEENNLSLSCIFSDLDCYTTDKSSKKVTFNKQISSKIFSRNQRTIETKKKGKKNKKNSNKKTKGNDDKKSMTQQSNEQQIEKSEFLTNENLVKQKSNMSNVSIDELSFLLCSSEESDTSNVPFNGNIDLKQTELKNTNESTNASIQDDDLLFDQKIDYQTLDKENWSSMKSSKKVKKNRKRNDSGSTNSATTSSTITQTSNSESTNSDNQEENCEKESVVGKQMSLGLKNLIQVN